LSDIVPMSLAAERSPLNSRLNYIWRDSLKMYRDDVRNTRSGALPRFTNHVRPRLTNLAPTVRRLTNSRANISCKFNPLTPIQN
jgi:hypothetical protein